MWIQQQQQQQQQQEIFFSHSAFNHITSLIPGPNQNVEVVNEAND